MNLSEKIKKIRIELHMKQDDIAIACNVTRGTVANWEMGRRNPSWENIAIIAKLFNVSIDDLVGEDFDVDSYILKQNKATKRHKRFSIMLSIFSAFVVIAVLIFSASLILLNENNKTKAFKGNENINQITATMTLRDIEGQYNCFDFIENNKNLNSQKYSIKKLDLSDKYFKKYDFYIKEICIMYISIFNNGTRYRNFILTQNQNLYNSDLMIWNNRIAYISQRGVYNIELDIEGDIGTLSILTV